MSMTGDQIEALTETIIGCAIEVHKTLGPGLLEAVYRECLILELRGSCLDLEIERHVPLDYKGQRIRSRLTVDLLGGELRRGRTEGRGKPAPCASGTSD